MSDEFTELFDRWSAVYDQTVAGGDVEYKDVFASYDDILASIATRSHGQVLEFGVGTGNLTKKLVESGLHVVGVEPSHKMREIAKRKLATVKIIEGDFLHYPDKKVDTIVSSYAFHHLTDEKKEQAIERYVSILHEGGKIVFGDTVFTDKQAHEQAILDAKGKGFDRLAKDLATEYYPSLATLDHIFTKHHFSVAFERMNDFVWIMEAKKQGGVLS
ncbi:MAG TPA: class I SAM-dependent methyltransferase [Virgibacillus sp.]|nr:class I SAM-dependent methyltransferase [Virgibacillus sp.]